MFSSFKAMSVTLLVAGMAAAAGAKDGPTYAIEHMKANVYRFTAGHHHSVFMVTDRGIFVTDPISEAAATYLREQLAERFDAPIRYLAYSHNHVDHVLGGRVLAGPGVTVIAHEYAAEDLEALLADGRAELEALRTEHEHRTEGDD